MNAKKFFRYFVLTLLLDVHNIKNFFEEHLITI